MVGGCCAPLSTPPKLSETPPSRFCEGLHRRAGPGPGLRAGPGKVHVFCMYDICVMCKDLVLYIHEIAIVCVYIYIYIRIYRRSSIVVNRRSIVDCRSDIDLIVVDEIVDLSSI